MRQIGSWVVMSEDDIDCFRSAFPCSGMLGLRGARFSFASGDLVDPEWVTSRGCDPDEFSGDAVDALVDNALQYADARENLLKRRQYDTAVFHDFGRSDFWVLPGYPANFQAFRVFHDFRRVHVDYVACGNKLARDVEDAFESKECFRVRHINGTILRVLKGAGK